MTEHGPQRFVRWQNVRADAIATTREYTMKVDGGCHCGSITFEAEIDPDARGQVHPGLRRTPDLRQDRRERCPARPSVLPRVRFADLRDVDGRRPVGPEPSHGHLEPARPVEARGQIWRRSALAWIGEIGSIPARETQ